MSPNEYTVTTDKKGVTCEHPKRAKESIAWDDVDQVSFLTTNQGPFEEDVWLLLKHNNGGGCSVPMGAEGYDALYDIISKFEDFDFNAVIQAMSSTQNNEFVCWRR